MKILKFIIGFIIFMLGAAIAIFSAWQVYKGHWAWITILFVGGIIAWTGFRIAAGDRLKEVFKDFGSALMWWVP